MSKQGTRTLVVLALQVAAAAALLAALLGGAWLDARSRPRLLVLVDRSESVPRADADKALAEVVGAARAAGAGEVLVIEFAGKPLAPSAPSAPSTPSTLAAAGLEPSATDIEAALDAALAAHARSPLAQLVMVSDGLENRGDAARALRALRQARLPLQWIAVGRPPPATRIAEVLAPDRALAGQRLPITVQLAGQFKRALRVTATARSADGQTQVASSAADAAGRAVIELDARRSGAVLVDLALEDAGTAALDDALPQAAVVDVAPRATLLYVQGSGGALASSLTQGGWMLDRIPAARLDAQADGLAGYQAVILDDVAIADAGPRFWNALAAAVNERGLGLMVLGGERSFARGGYRGSVLESLLPVLSEPAARDEPVAVVFAVDKSGSMGQGSGGVDRFALAQRAVLETARGLGERDGLGLMVFDVAPRVLIPLGPARAGIMALARPWQASPNGGTRLAPALDAAIVLLEGSSAARRMLVMVTDGFVDDAPIAELRARLDRSHIETIALAVGPDADVGALQHLIGRDTGVVLRVDQAAELPRVMRSGLERRRARIERGTIAVEQQRELPFPPGAWKDWPVVAAHAVTRPAPDATVAVQSQHGEPLIAWRTSGHGRVVAATSGLGPWTPRWLQWREWPRLAGGLSDWISGSAQGAAVTLAVTDLPLALQLEVERQGEGGDPDPGGVAIIVDTPTQQGLRVAAEAVAAGRFRATLPDAGAGLYTFLVSTAQGTQRHLHLRRQRAEREAWGTSPSLQAWRAAGLIRPWAPGLGSTAGDNEATARPLDRSLIALGLALFLTGVMVDRARPGVALVKAAVQRWRAHASRARA